MWVSASAIVRDWASVRVWVMVTWGSVGHGDVGECGSWRRESQRVSTEGESRGESEARWKRAIFSNPTHAERQRRVRGGMADVHAYALRRCATTGVGRWSAGRTRFQLTPDSASGDRVEREICTARRCRCGWIAGEPQRRRSAAHLRRCVCPRRCRGLTESVTAARSGSATTAIGDEVRRARSDSASGGVAHL